MDDERDLNVDTDRVGSASDEEGNETEDLSGHPLCDQIISAAREKGANTRPGPDENIIRKVRRRADVRDVAREVRGREQR